MDPQYNAVETNTLESVRRNKRMPDKSKTKEKSKSDDYWSESGTRNRAVLSASKARTTNKRDDDLQAMKDTDEYQKRFPVKKISSQGSIPNTKKNNKPATKKKFSTKR